MKNRKQVGNLNGPVQRKVVDTSANAVYVQAAGQPVDNTFGQLASALKSIEPGLSKLADQRIAAKTTAEKQAAVEARIKAKAGFKQAIDKGLIEPAQSPVFQEHYMALDQKEHARQYNLELNQAYATWDKKDSNNPQDFQEFLTEFRAERFEGVEALGSGTDLYAQEIGQYEHNMAQQHASYSQKRIYNETLDKTYNQLGSIITSDASAEDKVASITGLRQASFDAGVKGTDLTKTTVDAITNYAEQSNDLSILDLAESVKSGTGKLSGTKYGQEKLEAAADRITDRIIKNQRYLKQKAEDARKEKVEAQLITVAESLSEEPNAIFSQEFMDRGSNLDPKFASLVDGVRNAFFREATIGSRLPEDLDSIAPLYDKAYDPDQTLTARDVMSAVDRGTIRKRATFTQLLKLTQESKSSPSKKNPTATQLMADIKRELSDADEFGNISSTVASTGNEAANFGITKFDAWLSENPNSTVAEQRVAATEIKRQSVDLFRPSLKDIRGTGVARDIADAALNKEGAQVYDTVQFFDSRDSIVEIAQGVNTGDPESTERLSRLMDNTGFGPNPSAEDVQAFFKAQLGLIKAREDRKAALKQKR